MGDIVTFGVSLGVGGACLVLAAVFKWAPYFSSKFDWTDYAILPLFLTGVAGLMTATVAGLNVGSLINQGLSALQRGLNNVAPGLAWVIFIGFAVWVAFCAIGSMLEAKTDKKAAIYTGALPITLAMIPAPLGTVAISVVGFLVTIPTYLVSALMGM